MADVTIELLRTHFRQLRLPTMGQEFERLARDAAATNQTFVQFLLGLTEIELETRAANAVATRIKRVRSRQCQGFPRNPGRFHPGSGLSPSLDQLGAIEREASFL